MKPEKTLKKTLIILMTVVVLLSLNIVSKSNGLSNRNSQIGLGVPVANDLLSQVKGGPSYAPPVTLQAIVAVLDFMGLHHLAVEVETSGIDSLATKQATDESQLD